MVLIVNSNKKGSVSSSILYKKPTKTEQTKILKNFESYEKDRFKGYLKNAGVNKSVKAIAGYVKKEYGIKEKNKLLEAIKVHYAPATGLTEEQKKANIKVSRRMTELLDGGGMGISKRPTSQYSSFQENLKKRAGNIGGRVTETSIDKRKSSFAAAEKETVTSAVSQANKKAAGVTRLGNDSPVSSSMHKAPGIGFPR